MLKFTESYRNLNKITKLDLKKILVRDLFENLNSLMQPSLEKKHIELEIVLRDPALAIEADINLIEQVMINLLVNAIEAVKDREHPRITLSAEVQPITERLLKYPTMAWVFPPNCLIKYLSHFSAPEKREAASGSACASKSCCFIKVIFRCNQPKAKGRRFYCSLPANVPMLNLFHFRKMFELYFHP